MAKSVRALILVSLCLVPINLAFGDDPATPSGPTTITIAEAEALLNLVPVIQDLRAKGIIVKSEMQSVSTMNNKDYYFFWIYDATAQKQRDTGSISVGNYAVNKHTADVRVWQVSNDVFHGDDGVLVATSELARLQEELREKHGINSTVVQQNRSEHLADKIIPRAAAQSAVRLRVTERLADTSEVSCWKKGSDHAISRLGHSPIISSTAGSRAYAEVEATAFSPKYQETYTGPLCENISRLFLAGPEESEFKLAYSQAPPDIADGNSLKLIDWSPDGGYLLMERTIWKYESEGDYTDIVLFNVSSGAAIAPDLPKILEARFGKDCWSSNSVVGFTPEGNVVVAVSPLEDEYYNEGATSCVKQRTLIALDTKRGLQDIAEVLRGNFKAERYGQLAKPQAPRN
ncbi:MAG TPA: hypothetical protein VMI32_04750 [Candidatus Solibacter sp.]|nr:hypothetical protein [Candidatus Solibacter sp.]